MEHKRKTTSDVICESFYSASNLCPSRSDFGKNRVSGRVTRTSSGIPAGAGSRSGMGTGMETGTGSGGSKYREIVDTDTARSGRCSPIESFVGLTIDSNSLDRNRKNSTEEKDSEKEKETERKDDPFNGVLRFREYVAATMMKRIPVTDERLSLCFEILDIGTYCSFMIKSQYSMNILEVYH